MQSSVRALQGVPRIPKVFQSWFWGLKIAGWGATAAASAGAYHAGGIAAAAAVAMKGSTDLGPVHSGYHPAAAHHQLMADMYQGMSPATAINTMDWKNTSQVSPLYIFLDCVLL